MRSVSSARGAAPTGGRAVLAALVLGLTACYPGDPASIQELDIVGTKYDTEYDFSANRSFAMPDSVLHLCDIPELNLAGCIELGRDFDATMLARVVANMEAMGYTRELEPEVNAPDVVVLVSALGSARFVAYVSYPWWGGWGWWPGWGYCPGCYGPGWGWGYPPGSISAVRYETGTLFIDMVDPDEADFAKQEIPIPWTGALNGVLGSSAEQSVIDGIDQAFAQSPYLRAGK